RPGLRARRDAGEDRPRLWLAEDRAAADLTAGAVPARVPSLPGPLLAHRRAQLGAALSDLCRGGCIAEQVRQPGEAWIHVRKLRGDEGRLGHVEEPRTEVGPVAVAAGEISAPGAAQRLLMLVGELHVLPRGRGRGRVEEREGFVEERRVTRAEAVLDRRKQEPEVEVAGGAEIEALAERARSVGHLPAHLRLYADRVAQDLARQPGRRVDDRQQVVRPAARTQVQ